MMRSYNVDIARKTNIYDAIVLKEISYWCSVNKAKGINKFKGRYWTYGSIRTWQSRLPEVKNIGAIFKRLEAEGLLLSDNFNKTAYDRTKWYTLSDKAISLITKMDFKKPKNGTRELPEPIPTVKEDIIEEILKKNAEDIERIFRLYPSESRYGDQGNRDTGKCDKDRRRIASLLQDHTPEQIEDTIRRYVDRQGGFFLKNFGNFLDNLPEYEEVQAPQVPESPPATPQKKIVTYSQLRGWYKGVKTEEEWQAALPLIIEAQESDGLIVVNDET